MSITTIVPAMPGIVIYNVCLKRPAPSITAASYSSGSIPDNADKYIIEPHPTSCQIPDITIIGRKYFASPRK